ncbi:MAG: YbbC/YhhH family protein [Prevotella sp.]|jgi:hypothetical protein|nr:YbbC/YhhH family protein [Prevotella sp.]
MKTNRILLYIIVVALFCFTSCKTTNDNISNKPDYYPIGGLIPDEDTAKNIAEIIWKKHYGEGIEKQKPFIAILENGIWYVKGNSDFMLKNKMVGGIAYIEISQHDCHILNISHTK